MPRIPRANHSTSPTEIAHCRDFDCTNMSGRIIGTAGLHKSDAGWLTGSDLAAFEVDATAIRYVVYSYYTPIAWKTLSGRWHIVRQRFSPTTAKHQGRLYMIPRDVQSTESQVVPNHACPESGCSLSTKGHALRADGVCPVHGATASTVMA